MLNFHRLKSIFDTARPIKFNDHSCDMTARRRVPQQIGLPSTLVKLTWLNCFINKLWYFHFKLDANLLGLRAIYHCGCFDLLQAAPAHFTLNYLGTKWFSSDYTEYLCLLFSREKAVNPLHAYGPHKSSINRHFSFIIFINFRLHSLIGSLTSNWLSVYEYK
jgi:hypothetical protein